MHTLATLVSTANFHHLVPLFARGGGGGSGGGDGGGGGAIALIGYVPMHILGAWLRRLKAKHPVEFDVFQFGGWLVAILYTLLLIIVLRGIGVIAGIGAIVGIGAGLYGWFGKLKQNKQTKQALGAAAQQDSTWDEATLLKDAGATFMRYQQDWSNYHSEAMKAYMTPQYQYHASLMVYALQLAGRRNLVQDPKILQSMVTAVQDNTDNSKDEVFIGFTAQANDRLVDACDNSLLYNDNSEFTEFWRFKRQGTSWLLDGIQQATASTWTYNQSLEQFAAQQGYCFSLDWGWLLLPTRGRLFGKGKFGVSDINNHVIGMYNQCLVQLYTYNSAPNNGKTYLIAQANLPRSYGQIVVERKKGLRIFNGIHGLNEISTEWPDFNKKYAVYATNAEQATSLELLNPKYMEKLEALPFEVSIEVVDNVVYLYAPQNDKTASADRYPQMLNVLHEAFKEMRL